MYVCSILYSSRRYQHCHFQFPLMAKSDVNGDHTNEVYKWLKSQKAGLLGLTRIKVCECDVYRRHFFNRTFFPSHCSGTLRSSWSIRRGKLFTDGPLPRLRRRLMRRLPNCFDCKDPHLYQSKESSDGAARPT